MKRLITPVITLAVAMLVAIGAQAQAPTLSSINVVDKLTVSVERDAKEGIASSVNVNVESAVAKLKGTIDNTCIYVAQYDVANDAKLPELTNQTNNEDSTAVGWWLTEVYDEEQDATTGECAAAPYDAAATVLYIRDYNIAGGSFNLNVGHNRKNVTSGSNYYALLYIVSGTDAVEVKVEVKIKGETISTITLTDYSVKDVLATDIDINYNGSYRSKTIDVPADSLLGLMPVPDCCFTAQWYEGIPELGFYALESDGVLTNKATANNGGYWLDKNGYVCNWESGKCALFVEPDDSLGLNLLHVGIYPDYSLIDTTIQAKLYLVGEEIYTLNIKLNIHPQVTMNDCEVIDSLKYTVEIKTSTAGTGAFVQSEDMINVIDLSELVETELGHDGTSFIALSYFPGRGYQTMAAAYQISVNSGIENAPYMGYQMMDLDMFVKQTGDDSFAHIASPFNPLPVLTPGYAIGYDEGRLSFWQKDGVRKTGDYYTAKFIIYNTDAGKRIDLDLTVVYVDELNPRVDIVATQDLTLPKSNQAGEDYAATEFDISAVATALECNDVNDIKWMAYNELGQLLGTFTFDEIYGYTFTSDGTLTESESEQAVFSIGYNDGEFHTFVSNGEKDTDYTASIVAYYGTKAYKFNITLSDNATAIDCIPAIRIDNNATTYDLSGRVVKTPVRGLYIQNGKKVLVK